MTDNLFRPEALAKLRNPEQLDALLQLTRPWAWAALSIFGAVVAIVVAWGFLGSVPVQVQGLGLLLPTDSRIYQMQAAIGGLVGEMRVTLNQQVNAGDTIAVIALPVDQVALQGAQRTLEIAQRQYDTQKAFADRDVARRQAVVADMNRTLRKKIEDNNSYLAYLRQLLSDQMAEQKLGYITRQQTEATRTSIFNAEQSIAQARDSISQNGLSLIEFENSSRQTLDSLQNQVEQAQSAVASAAARIQSEQPVISPVDGIVTEVNVKPGVLVQAGSVLAVIEQRADRLELVGYFGIADGKKLESGMVGNVSPLSVERDLYGSIRGTVTRVGSLPETETAVAARIGNPTLAAQLMQGGAPIAAIVSLELDSTTPSGFRWTSSRGPSLAITSGETASVSVVVHNKRPIDLVIPLFDAWLY